MAKQTLYDEDGNPVEVEIADPPADPPAERTNSEWAELRKEKQARKAAEEKAAAYERRDAIAAAGVDVSTPLGKFFAEKYDGEATVEAVTAAAKAAGFVESTPAPAADPAVDAGLEAGDRIAAAAPGSAVVDPTNPTAALDAAYLAGGTEALIDAARGMGVTIQESQ